jgi:hypothetical protein
MNISHKAAEHSGPAAVSPADDLEHAQLDYLADMLLELKNIASQSRWHIVVAALDVAILAAHQQNRLIKASAN